jgi:hypothetical protein
MTSLAPFVTEAQLQDAIEGMAERLGWESWHDRDSRRNKAGLPDLLLVHPDHGVRWLELKTMRGRVRPQQQYWMDLLRLAGQRVYLIRPDMMDLVERILHGEDDHE